MVTRVIQTPHHLSSSPSLVKTMRYLENLMRTIGYNLLKL